MPWWQRPLAEQVQIMEAARRPAGNFRELMEQFRARYGIPHYDDLPTEEQPRVAPDGDPWCDTCGGKRWLRRAGPDGTQLELDHPDFGKLVRCPSCPTPAQQGHRDQLARAAGLVEAQVGQTFETFVPTHGATAALEAAQAFAEQPSGWLVINGGGGSGKTHLSVAIANALVERLQPVLWRYTPDLVAEVLDEAYHVDRGRLQRFVEVQVLVLDDLGAISGWMVQGVLEPLFDGRYRRRLPTVVTMMATSSDVRAHYSEAIGRRFEDPQLCRVVTNVAPLWSPGPPKLRVVP